MTRGWSFIKGKMRVKEIPMFLGNTIEAFLNVDVGKIPLARTLLVMIAQIIMVQESDRPLTSSFSPVTPRGMSSKGGRWVEMFRISLARHKRIS
jgi:hypothetical protein